MASFNVEGKAPGMLPTTSSARSVTDTQKQMFMQEVYQKEAEAAGYDGSDLHQDTLTPYQRDILKKIRSIEANPITVAPVLTTRSSEQVEASIAIHKRTNPGYVETPYTSTNRDTYQYIPAPDFTRNFLKKDSDCKFQKYAAEAILKHVDLKKTSH
uniref:Uncharacterized protein n=1 Tax=Haptolina ericina TaxID=156174 RepID=A0A7S3AQN3_9EUKA|mmetsp:Transcript_29646/g.67152  ORF Transcript_29646/g.67152 Transcript_29646/m.67152 type:complete len:156 (+) Transcript_29646:25-492(+)|eukprot:CAMPEP_0181211986 /NCGR_PEP_ID=MMETSP1096-20121128/24094_1 /TAXON_ID=156174 ORGANISM="Chrysochromulina ericina, Strain CCMP281" /NCGR_SAMPLE_ID=MMETSP1096 /ASSEMBLY_ACC=CAM_ASM_000453 /LENGTH=155 /DNA_ID=CAMNT_0023303455 /DNA_START=25 /DNA_END=492 /DNA_ORIENTATION=+